jgi:transcriptional regulator with XRE-family HTH domain
MAKRNADPIDVHVGNRVRMRRTLIGMSQEKLGDRLGLTFQQVQKYEKGSNRVSAGRLFRLSEILGVSVQFFYDDLADPRGGAGKDAGAGTDDRMTEVMTSAEGVQLNQAFTAIRSADVRRRIIDLVRAIAAE